MAEPNFTLSNAAFALSPMVLRATTEPGNSLTLTVADFFSGESIQVVVNADINGGLVYDVSPIVRDFLAAKFIRSAIAPDKNSPYGAYITIKLDNNYAVQDKMLWARKAADLITAIGVESGRYNTLWLLPTGKYVYRKGAPEGLITTISEDVDYPLYAQNKRTGVTIELSDDYYPYDAIFNHSDKIFDTLPAGEYRVYMRNLQWAGFDLLVEDCFPTDEIQEGSMAYVRFCNQWGGISYGLLHVTQRSTKNNGTYVQKAYALDDSGDGNYYHVAPDRVMTGQEIIPSFKAGKDKLSRAELEELQSILVSPMVDMYSVNTGEWIPVYPADTTVTQTNEALQEITIEFNLNTEGF